MKKILFMTLLFIASMQSFAHVEKDGKCKYYSRLAEGEILKKIPVDARMYSAPELDRTLHGRYPMFIIKLNDVVERPVHFNANTNESGRIIGLTCDKWKRTLTDYVSIELKASTNNFFKGKMGEKWESPEVSIKIPSNMVYWACSTRNPQFTSGAQNISTNSLRVFTTQTLYEYSKIGGKHESLYHKKDRYKEADFRSWAFYERPSDLGNPYVEYIVAIVDVDELAKAGKDISWACPYNEELVWSCLRLTAGGMHGRSEKDTDQTLTNNDIVWEPVYPVKWFREMPIWAYEPGETNHPIVNVKSN